MSLHYTAILAFLGTIATAGTAARAVGVKLAPNKEPARYNPLLPQRRVA